MRRRVRVWNLSPNNRCSQSQQTCFSFDMRRKHWINTSELSQKGSKIRWFCYTTPHCNAQTWGYTSSTVHHCLIIWLSKNCINKIIPSPEVHFRTTSGGALTPIICTVHKHFPHLKHRTFDQHTSLSLARLEEVSPGTWTSKPVCHSHRARVPNHWALGP